ncbi:MAG TPA: glycosyltransferase family 4 protein [Acidimicrobiales bacterium]|nr:glycosyltransferase family 4 protein [Acidimicrobiales bacterium]
MPTLHQFVPTLDPGAVGTHILEAQRVLRAAGWASEVFSEHTVGPYDGRARRYTDYGSDVAANDDDVLVYHLAIGSSVADWLLARRPPRLVVDYHNITPPEWFAGWEPSVAYGLAWGRAQLRRLAPRTGFGLADSAYNASELQAAGLRRTEVLPILLPDHDGTADATRVAELRAEPGPRWVFVGRLAPNKRQHLLIAALHAYRRAYDGSARLDLVGGASSPTYESALRAFTRDLGLTGAVTFTGPVSDSERDARYAAADVFVCMSGHEGFLVPVLEAWRHRVPIVAWGGAPAVAGTLGDAGLLMPEAEPEAAAATVGRVLGDPHLADALRARGDARSAQFAPGRTRARLLELADALAAGIADRPGLAGLLR